MSFFQLLIPPNYMCLILFSMNYKSRVWHNKVFVNITDVEYSWYWMLNLLHFYLDFCPIVVALILIIILIFMFSEYYLLILYLWSVSSLQEVSRTSLHLTLDGPFLLPFGYLNWEFNSQPSGKYKYVPFLYFEHICYFLCTSFS